MRKITFGIAIIIFIAFQIYYIKTERSAPADIPETDKLQENEELNSKNIDKIKAQPKKNNELEEQTLTHLYLVESTRQNKEWEVWADHAHKAMGSNDWDLKIVKADFFSEKVSYTVHGDQGHVDDVRKNMVIEGNVKLVSSNDYVFYTNKLIYDPAQKSIISSDKVSVEGPREGDMGRMYMEGIGLNVNLVTNLMVLEKNVLGQKPMSGKRSMSINSQRAEFSGSQKSAVFRNNVIIKVDQMVVKGSLASFQYKDGKLDTLTMDGGIHLQDQDKVGSAGEATVYFNEDKYIFRKKPFVTQGENELNGDEIIVFNKGERVQVKNAKAQYLDTEKNK